MSLSPLARAESVAASLPPLLVAAERVASTVAQGVHGRRRVGQGDTFWQFRPAEAGDSARAIDWRQSARAERLFVRQTEWEAAQTICLWRDGRARMGWRSHLGAETKRARADLLLLALAALLLRAGERVRLVAPGLPEFSGRIGLERLAATLAQDEATAGLPEADILPRHAHLVLIGDLLDPMEDIQSCLTTLAARPVQAHLLQVLDPAEQSLPYDGRVLFRPLDSGAEELVANVGGLRDAYTARLAAQRGAIADLCAGTGFGFQTHATDAPATTALLSLAAAFAPERSGRR